MTSRTLSRILLTGAAVVALSSLVATSGCGKKAGEKAAATQKAGDKKAGDKKAGDKKAGDKKAGDKTASKFVEVPKAGKKFDPPVKKDQIPPGAWYCDMGSVHYARMDKGDGKCPICHMMLKQKAPAKK